MNVTVLGASGFVGRHLSSALEKRGHDVIRASLRDVHAAAGACTGADAVVNLAGATIAKRWSAAQKQAIRSSRIDAPRKLLDLLAMQPGRPRAWISASAVGYYGTSETQTFDEASPPGEGFLARVCVEWERVANSAAGLGMRVAIVRSGVALGADGGALGALLPVFRLGLGGVAGNGDQWMSWVHVDDLVGVYLHALEGATGTFNACAPDAVTNREFSRALAKTLHRPASFPVPGFALRAMLGEGASIVLEGQRVAPRHTLESGYVFRFRELDPALRALLD